MSQKAAQIKITIRPNESVRSVVLRLATQADDVGERIGGHPTKQLFRESLHRYLVGAQLELNLGSKVPILPHTRLETWQPYNDQSAKYVFGGTTVFVVANPFENLWLPLWQSDLKETRPFVILGSDSARYSGGNLETFGLERHVSFTSIDAYIASCFLNKGFCDNQSFANGIFSLVHMYNLILKTVDADPRLGILIRLSALHKKPSKYIYYDKKVLVRK